MLPVHKYMVRVTPLKSKVKKKYQPQNNNNISKLKFLS